MPLKQLWVLARTCQWMHEATYSHSFLFLPRLWALERLPVGLPAGQWFCSVCALFFFVLKLRKLSCSLIHSAFSDVSLSLSCSLWFLPVVAPLNEIPAATIDNLMRYVPILRQPEFGMVRAADYLESWCNGSLVRMPLLDLSEFFGLDFICYANMCDLLFLSGKITAPEAAPAVLGSKDQITAEPARTPSAIRFVFKDCLLLSWLMLLWFL